MENFYKNYQAAVNAAEKLTLFFTERELCELRFGQHKDVCMYDHDVLEYEKRAATSMSLFGCLVWFANTKHADTLKQWCKEGKIQQLLNSVIGYCDDELNDVNPDYEKMVKKCRDSLSSLIRA